MTIESITATVDSALPVGAQGKYPREYDALVAALTEREYDLTDMIVSEVSTRFGVDEGTVRGQAVYLGLAVRPEPEPEPEPEAPAVEVGSDLEGRVARIESAVAHLTELAERHLGARR